jgi:hypothetical protein
LAPATADGVDVHGAHERAEDAEVVGGLVGVGAAQARRTVGGDDDEPDIGMSGLEDGWVQVGDGRARRADHRRGRAGLGQAEGEEACGPLVDAGVQAEVPRLGRVVRRERQRRVPGPGREHHLGDAGPLDEGRDHLAGQPGRRVRHER